MAPSMTIQPKTKQDPLNVFHEALRNVSPALEVRSRRVGGATYQVPVEVRTDRSRALAIRWIITAARARNEPTMHGQAFGRTDGCRVATAARRSRSAKTPTRWPKPIAPSRIIAGKLSKPRCPAKPLSIVIAISASPRISTPARPRRPSASSITRAAAIRSAKCTMAPPPWTSWSRNRSAASPSRPRRPPVSGKIIASTSSTRLAMSISPSRSSVRCACWTARWRCSTRLRASSRNPKPCGARPTNIACRASASSTRWTAPAPIFRAAYR